MLKTYKYELYPDTEQNNRLQCWFGTVRWVYNWGLERKIKYYNETGKTISCFELDKELTTLKNTPEFLWITDVNAQSLQMSLRNLDNAFTNFFKQHKKFPKFKSKKKTKKSIQFPQKVKINFNTAFIQIPKIGLIPFSTNMFFDGKIKTCALKETSTNRFFIYILVENGLSYPEKLPIIENKTIGIDLGVKTFATLNNGIKIENNKYYHKALQELRVHSKRLSKKKFQSTNYMVQKLRVAKIHEKIVNQRKDFLSKLSTSLVCDNQTTSFCVEDLNIKGMVQNYKLARHIADSGWDSFIYMLQYKCKWYGKNFIQIGRFEASSKTCSCGKINHTLKLSDRIWTCKYCGSTHDRDVLAANNIKLFGLVTAMKLKLEGGGTSSSINKAFQSDCGSNTQSDEGKKIIF